MRDILEFAAYVGVLGSEIVDTEKGSSPPTDSNPPDPTLELLDLPGPPGTAGGADEGAVEPPTPPLMAIPPSRAALDWGAVRVDKAKEAGHKLVFRRNYVFCRRCARYARDRWSGLLSQCRPGAQRVIGGRLNRLWEGLHPTTRKPL